MKGNKLNQEIYKIVSDYHTATQGSYDEEMAMKKIYDQAKLTYGEQAVLEVVKYYNENVIRKAI
jgi:hypothetical protein